MLRRPGGTAFTGVRGLTTVGKMEAPARELPVEVGETSLFERAGGGRRAGVPGGQDDLERANTDYRQRLRDAGFGRHLIRYWEEAVEGLDVRNAIPPDLRNRDGDPLLLTVDHFEVTPEDMAAIDARINEMEGAQQEAAGEDASVYVFLRPHDATRPDGEQTVVGRVQMAPRALRIETNSQARADAARTDRGRLRLSDPTPRARAHGSAGAQQGCIAILASHDAGLTRTAGVGSGVQGAPLRRLARPAAAGAEPQDAA